MSPIKHTDSVLCNCPICLAVRAMRTRLLCRSHVLFPCHGRPARGKPGSNLGPGRPGSLVNASAVGGSLTRFPWWTQSSQIGQVKLCITGGTPVPRGVGVRRSRSVCRRSRVLSKISQTG